MGPWTKFANNSKEKPNFVPGIFCKWSRAQLKLEKLKEELGRLRVQSANVEAAMMAKITNRKLIEKVVLFEEAYTPKVKTKQLRAYKMKTATKIVAAINGRLRDELSAVCDAKLPIEPRVAAGRQPKDSDNHSVRINTTNPGLADCLVPHRLPSRNQQNIFSPHRTQAKSRIVFRGRAFQNKSGYTYYRERVIGAFGAFSHVTKTAKVARREHQPRSKPRFLTLPKKVFVCKPLSEFKTIEKNCAILSKYHR